MNNNSEKKYDLLCQTFIRAFVWLIATFGVILVFGIVLEKLEDIVNFELMQCMGSNFVIFTAAIGTPVHELGHLLMAMLFGFRIVDVQLFRPFQYQYDGILGYVSYYYDRSSIIGQVGSFFAGIAPMLFGGIFILIVLRVLIPEVYRKADAKSDEIKATSKRFKGVKSSLAFAREFFSGLFKLRGLGIVRAILASYIVMSISMHMTLSTADLKNGITGFYILCVFYLIYGFISALLHDEDYFMDAIEVAGELTMFFMIGVTCDLLLLGLAKVLLMIGI